MSIPPHLVEILEIRRLPSCFPADGTGRIRPNPETTSGTLHPSIFIPSPLSAPYTYSHCMSSCFSSSLLPPLHPLPSSSSRMSSSPTPPMLSPMTPTPLRPLHDQIRHLNARTGRGPGGRARAGGATVTAAQRHCAWTQNLLSPGPGASLSGVMPVRRRPRSDPAPPGAPGGRRRRAPGSCDTATVGLHRYTVTDRPDMIK